eukprot:4565588-Pyramimonas_sp.AAC.1
MARVSSECGTPASSSVALGRSFLGPLTKHPRLSPQEACRNKKPQSDPRRHQETETPNNIKTNATGPENGPSSTQTRKRAPPSTQSPNFNALRKPLG